MLKPPNVLFMDIETSSLWNRTLTIEDPQQPWAVSLAFALCSDDGEFQNFGRFLIKPEGRSIQTKAGDVHGITTREASQFGVPEARILGLLSDCLKTMPMDSYIRVVSFGDFDACVISSLFARFATSQGKPSNTYDRLWRHRPLVEFVNLMTPYAEQICKIPSKEVPGSLKWPSLDEAAEIILGREPRVGKHDSWQDMLILRDLYIRIREMGMLKEGMAA